MTRFALWFALPTLLALQSSATDVSESSVLTLQAREKIRVLADEHSHLMEIFLAEQPDTASVPMSSVPARAKTKAATWIPKVMQTGWLPADIQTKFVALKDVKLWEKRDEKGMLIFEDVGDFLTLDHEVAGYGIHVHESGVTVSLRVDFPQPVPIGDDPGTFIRKCLTDFLNIPDEVVAQLQGDVKEELPVYLAHLRSPQAVERHLTLLRTQHVTPADRERWMKERQWWDRVYVCTDGHFFFVKVIEVEPVAEGRYNLQAKPGLPDRF